MENSASSNAVIQGKSDSDINLNTNGIEASRDMENSNNVGSETAPESENENVISDNGKEIEMAATMKCVEEAKESDEISENDKIKCDLKYSLPESNRLSQIFDDAEKVWQFEFITV